MNRLPTLFLTLGILICLGMTLYPPWEIEEDLFTKLSWGGILQEYGLALRLRQLKIHPKMPTVSRVEYESIFDPPLSSAEKRRRDIETIRRNRKPGEWCATNEMLPMPGEIYPEVHVRIHFSRLLSQYLAVGFILGGPMLMVRFTRIGQILQSKFPSEPDL